MTRRVEDILGLPVRRDRWNSVARISPEQAKEILEAQPPQRPVSQRHVDDYTAQMKSGRFTRTHQGMACDEAGLLFDGQHRLWACFLSGVTIEIVLFFNEPRANFAITDRGDRRNEAQDSIMVGVYSDRPLANTGVAAARFIWAYDSSMNPVHASVAKGWNHEVHMAVLGAHPRIPQMVHEMDTSHRRRLRLPAVVATALFTLFDEADEDKAAIFRHQVMTGEGLMVGDPALTFREKFSSAAATQRGIRTESAYWLARAWNAFYAGRKVDRLYGSASPNGAKARIGGLDVFPRIAGYRSAA